MKKNILALGTLLSFITILLPALAASPPFTVNSRGGALLSLSSVTVDDDCCGGSVGNGNGLIDAGETVELLVTLENLGAEQANDVSAFLVSDDQYVTIIDAAAECDSIAGSSTGQCTEAFSFSVDSSVPAGRVVTFLLEMQTGHTVSAEAFTVTVHDGIFDNYKLRASDAGKSDIFGASVSASNHYAIVGAPYAEDEGLVNSGAAYIYEKDANGSWNERAKLLASGPGSHDVFGSSVSISGSYAIVGAHGDGEDIYSYGAAYIFERDGGGNWSEVSKLMAAAPDEEDKFGSSVSISGNYAIVGAYGDDDNGKESGSAAVFERDDAGNWSEVRKLVSSNPGAGDKFGSSVSISGSYAIVGSHGKEQQGVESGAAVIYERGLDGNWNEVSSLVPSDPESGDSFGFSVAINGNYALVGAPGDDDGGEESGSAIIYERDEEGSWKELGKLMSSDPAAGDQFGHSVAISGSNAIVGALGDDHDGSENGSVTIFERRTDGSWKEAYKLPLPDSGLPREGLCGLPVAISLDAALYGACNDGDREPGSGSASIFIVDEADSDRDGVSNAEDCNDADSDIGPEVEEICSDNIDQNCDGRADEEGCFIGPSFTFGTVQIDDDNHGQSLGNSNGQADAGEKIELLVTLQNAGNGVASNVAAVVTQGSRYITIVEENQEFGDIAAGSTAQCEHAYVIEVDSNVPDGSVVVFSMDIVSDEMVVTEAFGFEITLNNDGSSPGNFNEVKKVIANQTTASNEFGYSLSVSGNYAIAGAPSGADGGSASIFERDANGEWVETSRLTARVPTAGDEFGFSVAIDGTSAVVGAPSDGDGGSAYIFERDTGGHWREHSKLTAKDPVSGDGFGFSVAIGENQILVGAPYDDTIGSVHTYQRGATGEWRQFSKLTAPGAASGDEFGFSVSISERFIVVGAPTSASKSGASGLAYIFELDESGIGSKVFTLSPRSNNIYVNVKEFGWAVASSSTTVIVGAPEADEGETKSNGSVHVYRRSEHGTWLNILGLCSASSGYSCIGSDKFGSSVALSGDYAIIGAPENDNDGQPESGAAYIFKQYDGNSWEQVSKHTASDASSGDFFGHAVALSGSTAFVGAVGNDDNGEESGSVYILEK